MQRTTLRTTGLAMDEPSSDALNAWRAAEPFETMLRPGQGMARQGVRTGRVGEDVRRRDLPVCIAPPGPAEPGVCSCPGVRVVRARRTKVATRMNTGPVLPAVWLHNATSGCNLRVGQPGRRSRSHARPDNVSWRRLSAPRILLSLYRGSRRRGVADVFRRSSLQRRQLSFPLGHRQRRRFIAM